MTVMHQTIDYSTYADGTVLQVKLADLVQPAWGNVRKKRNPEKFKELCHSVKNNGVTQGITIRPCPSDNTKCEVLAGNGRWEASKENGFETIPAVLKQVDDREAYGISLDENLTRESLGLVDEARASQRFVDFYDGDYAAAAEHLGWEVRKVRQRIELMRCDDEVLSALDAKQIKLGHATILCSFTKKTQRGTLEKILAEKWTVEELRKRAEQGVKNLDKAPFDKSDCQICPNNSEKQGGLFDVSVSAGRCANAGCYNKKLVEFTEAKREQLKSEGYEKVLLSYEKPVESRATVSPDNVGEEQFNKGCSGCADCALVIEVAMPNAGKIIENQCVNLSCYKKQANKYQLIETVDATNEVKPQEQKKSAPAKAENTTDTSPAIEQKTPKAVTENHKAFLRKMGTQSVKRDPSFSRAMMLYSMMQLAARGEVSATETVANFLQVDKSALLRPIADVVRLFAGFDEKSLGQACIEVMAHILNEGGDGVENFTNLMIGMVADKDYTDEVKAAWKPDEKIIKSYRHNRLTAICKESGFAEHYDTENGEGAFEKLAKKRKSDLDEAILKSQFGWDNYAPSELLSLIPEKTF